MINKVILMGRPFGKRTGGAFLGRLSADRRGDKRKLDEFSSIATQQDALIGGNKND